MMAKGRMLAGFSQDRFLYRYWPAQGIYRVSQRAVKGVAGTERSCVFDAMRYLSAGVFIPRSLFAIPGIGK